MAMPRKPQIYHITHIDRLRSIVEDECLWCDAIMTKIKLGTNIGINGIKRRRLQSLLSSHANLHVGDCVPFYFCPRSIMLYLLYKGNHPELTYNGGQDPIVHLEADFSQAVQWADTNNLRWAFTLSNAGSSYFEDRHRIEQLDEINWDAVQANNWQEPQIKEGKQAEFLLERQFPWELVSRIGVNSKETYQNVSAVIRTSSYRPHIDVIPSWYY